MQIIKDNIKEICLKSDYQFKNEYKNIDLNTLFNYWNFFSNNEEKIQNLTCETIDVVLYSKYYWACRFVEKYELLFGFDAGIEQQCDSIIVEISDRLGEKVDWSLMENINKNGQS